MAVLSASPVLWAAEATEGAGFGPAQQVLPLNRDWLFGGALGASDTGFSARDFNDAAFSRITLPHSVAPLSWRNWRPEDWEKVWMYRRHFDVSRHNEGLRYFLHFDRVMAGATPTINGTSLTKHLGGFLPFEYEITGQVRERGNVLAVAVDGRWLSVPPSGSPKGPTSIDYLLPAGITGRVSLRAVPRTFIRDVFAKAANVLEKRRRLDVSCQLDSTGAPPASLRLEAELKDAFGVVARTARSFEPEEAGQEIKLTITGLERIKLWDTENPALYTLVVTLYEGRRPVHNHRTRIGFRETRFELDGFFLNGRRLQLFGLDRHELYPYGGFAASDRLLRRDAEILRRDFNCNAVRCSHYPQSEAFLDACDELGLLVWEEIPGWQYLGDESWRKLVLRDVRQMVIRDRNHPSIMIWGVRINESHNDPALYTETRSIAKSLDDTRATSGSMTRSSMKTWSTEWHQDVFAFDDYHAAQDGSVAIREPLPGVPYMLAEAVGQFNYPARHGFNLMYRRAADPAVQMKQALFHAQAHSKAADYPRCAGVIAWCAFDYASLINAYDGVKYAGVSDFFRIPKLGAAFYKAQVDPAVRIVIEPDFYWDFGPQTPSGPGDRAAIFSNCDRLEISIGGKKHSVLHPDTAGFPHLLHAPFFADLKMDDVGKPELRPDLRPDLRIDGYVKGKLALSRSFSANPSHDRLLLAAGDTELEDTGSDATWLAFRAVDQYGAPRPLVGGGVKIEITGPGEIVGDNPFDLAGNGGAGAVWIKTKPGRTGHIKVSASHPTLGKSSVEIRVQRGRQNTPMSKA